MRVHTMPQGVLAVTLLLSSVSAMAQEAPVARRPVAPPRATPSPQPTYSGPVVKMQTVEAPGAASPLGVERYKLTLWGKRDQYNDWFPVCYAPCEAATFPADSYQLRGLRIPPSAEFMLPRRGEVLLQISPGRYKNYMAGTVVAILSSPFIIQSLTTLLIGSKEVRIVGASLLGVGLGMLIGGMVTASRSLTTVTTVVPHPRSRLALRGQSALLALTPNGLTF